MQKTMPSDQWIQALENLLKPGKGLWMQYQVQRSAADEGAEAALILKGLLRKAPDVILLGEVRETAICRQMEALSVSVHRGGV
jgi:Tfp pilus assembly pilus retraction ATPase PilT